MDVAPRDARPPEVSLDRVRHPRRSAEEDLPPSQIGNERPEMMWRQECLAARGCVIADDVVKWRATLLT
jgi:hypothetical protein